MEIRVIKRVLHTSLERKRANHPVAEPVSEAGSWREANVPVGSRRANPGIDATMLGLVRAVVGVPVKPRQPGAHEETWAAEMSL